MKGKTVQIIEKSHAFYGLYCVVVHDYGDGFLRCTPVNGGASFTIGAKSAAMVVGVA